MEWLKKQSLSVRRHLSTAAVIATQVYNAKIPEWNKLQVRYMKEFDDQRKGRKLTIKQKDQMPKGGFDRIKKVISTMKKELQHLKNLDSVTDLVRYQDLIILSLYYEYPLRLDYATLKLDDTKSGNCLVKNTKKPRGWRIILRDFKTVKSKGNQDFKLGPANQRLLNKFVPAVKKLTTHGFLLTNSRGQKMTKQVLSKRLMQITSKRIGKAFSVQLLRILYAMRNRDVIESAKEVSDKLLHSAKQSLQYAKKD